MPAVTCRSSTQSPTLTAAAGPPLAARMTAIRVRACARSAVRPGPACTTRRARRTPRCRACGPSRSPGFAVPGRSAAASRGWGGSRQRRSAAGDPGSGAALCAVAVLARSRPAAATVLRSRPAAWSSAPLAFHRCCQRPRGEPAARSARHHPEPAGLVAGRVVQRERRGEQPGQHRGGWPGGLPDDATARGGNAASSCATVVFTSPVAGDAARRPLLRSPAGCCWVPPEQDVQGFRPVSGRRWCSRLRPGLAAVVGEDFPRRPRLSG